jgi:hypothetical protein
MISITSPLRIPFVPRVWVALGVSRQFVALRSSAANKPLAVCV